jgi:hypothetical protein
MTYTCPVCGYQSLPGPPRDYEICPSCGTEFEYHDAVRTHAELRDRWVHQGALWHSRAVPKPYGWNASLQLLNAGFLEIIPFLARTFQEVEANAGDENAEAFVVCAM